MIVFHVFAFNLLFSCREVMFFCAGRRDMWHDGCCGPHIHVRGANEGRICICASGFIIYNGKIC